MFRCQAPLSSAILIIPGQGFAANQSAMVSVKHLSRILGFLNILSVNVSEALRKNRDENRKFFLLIFSLLLMNHRYFRPF